MEIEPGKLFIGGISWDTNEDRLREYFRTFGEVVEAVIMKDRTTGRARGFGFVVFADPAVAERVVLEKHMIDGRAVEAKKAVPRDDHFGLNKSNSSVHGSPGPFRTKKIFVGGLASTVTESDFKKYFDQFGTITDVVVMYDHNTQRPRGFGFITYDSEEAVDKVLVKTFHELNGKMVEVKRAVPKELSPGSTRSQLNGYAYGLGRFSNILNAYTQGYNPNLVGGYGVRMEGRLSPVTLGRSGYPPLSPGYGMGLNFETALSPSYGGISSLNSNVGYGRGSNPYYSGALNQFSTPNGYGGNNGGNNSAGGLSSRNLWGNVSLSYLTNSASSSSFMDSGSGNSGVNAFGNIGAIWDSPVTSQGGMTSSAYGGGNLTRGNGDISFGLGEEGYGRNNGTTLSPTSSFTAPSGGYDGAFRDFYEGGSIYSNPTWRSSNSEVEGSDSFNDNLGASASDVATKNSAGYVGYSVTNRQSNRGN
ncbi:RNA recognition motif domain, partial [Dillenia turbinata]